MIHFVGAGPGAADLITMRGHQLLLSMRVLWSILNYCSTPKHHAASITARL